MYGLSTVTNEMIKLKLKENTTMSKYTSQKEIWSVLYLI